METGAAQPQTGPSLAKVGAANDGRKKSRSKEQWQLVFAVDGRLLHFTNADIFQLVRTLLHAQPDDYVLLFGYHCDGLLDCAAAPFTRDQVRLIKRLLEFEQKMKSVAYCRS